MTTQQDRATAFQALHIKGNPLILFNMWDVASANAVAKAGAKALATGSRSVAGAFGFGDGEMIPLALALEHVSRIVTASDLPITFDFEGAYATGPEGVAANTRATLATGIIGFNFEDQILGTAQLYSIPDQAARIAAMRGDCDVSGVNAFINARTDIFLKAPRDTHDSAMVDHAIERAIAYHKAGASGFFAPGLVELALIKKLCAACPLPVNVMALPGAPDNKTMANAGVARISYGPIPWAKAMAFVEESARAAMGLGSL
jgi:2-methylisocitrate lyase-like PEP mutase family enzyme